MEEKNKKAKEVSIKDTTPENPEPTQKLTYEQLEQVAQNLNQQCQELYKRLKEADKLINSFNDIGLLLSIIKQSEYFSEDFIGRCSSKVETLVTNMLDAAEKEN